MSQSPLLHRSRLDMCEDIARKVGSKRQLLGEEVNRHEGASVALFRAMECLEIHKTHVKDKLDKKELDQKRCKADLLMLDTAIGIVHNLREEWRINLISLKGRFEEAVETVEVCRSMFDDEKKKMQASIDALTTSPAALQAPQEGEGAEGGTVTSIAKRKAPGPGLAAERRHEQESAEITVGEPTPEPEPSDAPNIQ